MFVDLNTAQQGRRCRWPATSPTTGALAGTAIDLDSSVGPVAQVGLDVEVAKNWFVSADLRYIGIKTTATLGGDLSTVDVDINPLVYTVAVGTRF